MKKNTNLCLGFLIWVVLVLTVVSVIIYNTPTKLAERSLQNENDDVLGEAQNENENDDLLGE